MKKDLHRNPELWTVALNNVMSRWFPSHTYVCIDQWVRYISLSIHLMRLFKPQQTQVDI